MEANGYFFVTAGSDALDPVRWRVDASTDNGTTWYQIGASGSRIVWDGSMIFNTDLTYRTPIERGAVLVSSYLVISCDAWL